MILHLISNLFLVITNFAIPLDHGSWIMIPVLYHSALLFTSLPYSTPCAVRHKEHPHLTVLSLPLPRSEHSSWDTTGSKVGPSWPGPGIYFKRRNVCKRTLAHNKNVKFHTYTIPQLISVRRTGSALFPFSRLSVKCGF